MLADKLTYDWEKYARYLSVDESTINNVKKKFKTTLEQTMQVLNQWRRENPSKKWRYMKDGLILCERKELITECEQSRFLNI